MAEAMDNQMPTESKISCSEFEQSRYKGVQNEGALAKQKEAQEKAALAEQKKARNEAALAAMAANYGKRFKHVYPYPGEFARYFEAIKDGGEAEFTEETLETAKALQPAIDYYIKVLPSEFLLLPFFSDKNETSAHFGPLPPVGEMAVSRFQRALHRLQSICEVTRQTDPLRKQVKLHYYDDRDKVSPYSPLELSQVKMLYEMLFYRMFQVCGKLFDQIEKRQSRRNPAAREDREKNIIHGIVSHGLQFMHEFETQSTDKAREELIRKIGKGRWLGPRFWDDPRCYQVDIQEELCGVKRVIDNFMGYIPRDCRDTTCRECNYHEEELPLPSPRN